jgi:hypothetical protein
MSYGRKNLERSKSPDEIVDADLIRPAATDNVQLFNKKNKNKIESSLLHLLLFATNFFLFFRHLN